MSIQALFNHVFVRRGFFGLLASAWGFMLGGSVLMTALTYGLALAGLARDSVLLSQVAVGAMLTGAAWVIMEQEYREKDVTNVTDFVVVFLLTFLIGAAVPIIFVIGAVVTWREMSLKRGIPNAPSLNVDLETGASLADRRPARRRRSGLVGFLQDLMSRSLLRLAH